MDFSVKNFEELSNEELYKILKARSDVFVVEQNCVYPDLDDIDYKSVHIFCRDENAVLAYLRLYRTDDGALHIGRVLTLNRGSGLGKAIVMFALDYAKNVLKADGILCEAQSYAIGFYEKAGFVKISDEFILDGIPHVKMYCNLSTLL